MSARAEEVGLLLHFWRPSVSQMHQEWVPKRPRLVPIGDAGIG